MCTNGQLDNTDGVFAPYRPGQGLESDCFFICYRIAIFKHILGKTYTAVVVPDSPFDPMNERLRDVNGANN